MWYQMLLKKIPKMIPFFVDAYDNETSLNAEIDDSDSFSDESEDEFHDVLDDFLVTSRSYPTQAVENHVNLFSPKMYKYTNVSRKRADNIISDVSTLFDNHMQSMKKEINGTFNRLSNKSVPGDEINEVLDKFSSPLKNMST